VAAVPTGREDVPAEAQRFLDAIGRGARALVIQGEAGVGKTAYLDATLDEARARGHHVLCARPVQAEAGLAYAALGDLLRPHLDVVQGLAAPLRRSLEVALLLEDAAAGGSDPQAIALAVLAVLRSLAEVQPVVVAVDDAPWLDRPSAAALAFVARRLGDSPVVLAVSARQGPEAPAPLQLGAAFSGARFLTVTVAPMSLAATQRLLRRRLELVLPRPALRRLHELAAGNPFFALELGRAYRAGTVQLDRGERLPVTLEAVVAERLAALTPHARHAAAAAAAMTQPTGALVTAVSGPAPLAELERAGIVGLDDGRVRFSHPLLASGAYSGVEADERRSIHAAIAAKVADGEERARHLALAGTAPDAAVAGLLENAAARAAARGAPEAAADLYAHAARFTPAESEAQARRRRVEAASCLVRSGDSARAREQLEAIVAALGPGPERARALVRLARVRAYDDDLRAAEAVFRQSAAESGDDVELRAEAQEGAASILFRLRERLSQAIELATCAEVSQNVGLRAEALGIRLIAETALGRTRAAETLDAALALQTSCRHRRTMAQPLFAAAVVWLWLDDLERARTAFQLLYDDAGERGEESSLPYILVMLAQVACVQGEFATAVRLADEGHGLTEQAGQAAMGAYLLALRALANAAGEDPERAEDDARTAIAITQRTRGGPAEQFARAALGLLYLARGHAEQTANALREQVQHLRDEEIVEPGAARFVCDHIEALIELGDTTAARELLEWHEAHATRLGRASALATAARCRGLLVAAAGDPAAALQHLQRALELHDVVDIPLDRARTLLALGVTHRRAKHKRAAREALDAAAEIFERLGARAWLQRLAKERARIGGRAPGGGQLTPSERGVADLVAEGLATKQVAAALFISPKTVEGHLSRIYAKLDVHSRAELARLLTLARPPR
jgi:DNA-binding CsgD family transcriptional regulator